MNSQTLSAGTLLKTLIILLFMIDYAMLCFWPFEVSGRVIGALYAPLWFFLIGYNVGAGPRLDRRYILAGTALVAGFIIAGQFVFPLNILLSLAAAQLVLVPVMRVMLAGPLRFWLMALALIALAYPSYIVLHFGTAGLMFAAYGYMVRYGGMAQLPFLLLAALVYSASQTLVLGLDNMQAGLLTGMVVFAMFVLRRFDPAVPVIRMAPVLSGVLRGAAHHLPLVYAGLLLALLGIFMALYPEIFSFMRWSLFFYKPPF